MVEDTKSAPEVCVRRTLLGRIWHGEVSLGRVFWVGAVSIILADWVYSLAVPYISFLVPKAFWSYGAILAGLLYCLLPALALLWLVFVWRAGWRAGQRWKAWPITAIAVSCIFSLFLIFQVQLLAPLLKDAFNEIIEDPQRGPRGVQLNSEDQSVLVYGYISRSVAKDLAATLNSHPDVRLVEFDSEGGRVSPAEQIGDLIRSRGLDTRVSNGCISACILAFLGGHERFMRVGASFGFHAAIHGDGSIGEEQTESIRQRVIAAGVAKPFVARAFRERLIWYPSAQELKAAGVVTVILLNQ
ncbi:MAG TPA: hypothetical protein VJP60_07920 [Rhizomicrobium sp.]|nr:hypothetical protein [Rhizomicrobium sp.]